MLAFGFANVLLTAYELYRFAAKCQQAAEAGAAACAGLDPVNYLRFASVVALSPISLGLAVWVTRAFGWRDYKLVGADISLLSTTATLTTARRRESQTLASAHPHRDTHTDRDTHTQIHTHAHTCTHIHTLTITLYADGLGCGAFSVSLSLSLCMCPALFTWYKRFVTLMIIDLQMGATLATFGVVTFFVEPEASLFGAADVVVFCLFVAVTLAWIVLGYYAVRRASPHAHTHVDDLALCVRLCVHVRMYVCTCVCMCVRMYACMYICMCVVLLSLSLSVRFSERTEPHPMMPIVNALWDRLDRLSLCIYLFLYLPISVSLSLTLCIGASRAPERHDPVVCAQPGRACLCWLLCVHFLCGRSV
jgi:hypothetical protein